MNLKRIVLILFCTTLLSACASGLPKSFTKGVEPAWISIPLRDDVTYEHAWNSIFNILSREFDIDMALKDDGYILTHWLFSWSGDLQANYRVKVAAKFSEDKRVLQIKPEAHAMLGPNLWIRGVDTRLTSTLKTDIMGTMGRTTR